MRPPGGWLRAAREVLGLSLEDVGSRIQKSRGRIKDFETAEAADRITLRSLRHVADAMDCDLVYAIVPRKGLTPRQSSHKRLQDRIREDVLSVENTMALEDQAAGNVEALIEDETKRRRKQ